MIMVGGSISVGWMKRVFGIAENVEKMHPPRSNLLLIYVTVKEGRSMRTTFASPEKDFFFENECS